ncbi:MAG: hypothetical protein ACXVA7_17750, partial [Isosphaeraceae bacterium]
GIEAQEVGPGRLAQRGQGLGRGEALDGVRVAEHGGQGGDGVAGGLLARFFPQGQVRSVGSGGLVP